MMNKGELVALIAEQSKQSKVDAEKALNSVIEAILLALKDDGDITLVGFGSFSVQERKARMGRNPQTGEPMQIAAYRQPVFKAGKRMKESCNPSNL
jgi:DNA-binding protein HU-beta